MIYPIIQLFNKGIHKRGLAPRLCEGFSVIEMLVVIALLGIISAIVTQVLVISVRSNLKAEIQKEVKQNGDYAMAIMERAIRNATDVDVGGCNVSSNHVTITNPDATNTTFTCNNAPKKIISSSGGGVDLTNNRVAWNTTCTFRVICPTPPIRPKYVYINFTLTQAGVTADPNSSASLPYQSTIELRSNTP